MFSGKNRWENFQKKTKKKTEKKKKKRKPFERGRGVVSRFFGKILPEWVEILAKTRSA